MKPIHMSKSQYICEVWDAYNALAARTRWTSRAVAKVKGGTNWAERFPFAAPLVPRAGLAGSGIGSSASSVANTFCTSLSLFNPLSSREIDASSIEGAEGSSL